MRIERVSIKNFRQYKNVVFEFDKKGQCDLHIILGNNGIGKTNLLNAISWCLYGKESHLGNEKRARKRINSTVLEESISSGAEKCSVIVAVTIGVDNKHITFERSQEFKANKEAFEFKPSFVVTVIAPSGNEVITDLEKIDNLLKQYLPEDIKEYFFFDGEQLDKYFISNQGEKIHQAIYNVSQVNLLDSMRDRLEKVIQDFQDEAGSKNIGIKQLNEKKNSQESTVTNLNNRIDECKKQINLAESEIIICNEYLAGKDGVPDKENEYQYISSQIESKEVELEDQITRFSKFVREYKILFSMYPKLKKTLDLINENEEKGQLPANIDPQFLKRMLEYHKCLICNRNMDEIEENAVKDLLKKLELSSTVSHLLVKIKSPLEDAMCEAANCQRG